MSKPKGDSDIQIPDQILRELLTPTELKMLKNRYLIISLLAKGLSIRAVAQRAKVGTDTVVRVSKIINREKVKALMEVINPVKKSSSSSTYVFGKSED